MPQFVGEGWPEGLSPGLLDALGEILAHRCAAIKELGVPNPAVFTHYWHYQLGRCSDHPSIMYTTPGLFDTREANTLWLMACVIADSVTEFCLSDPNLARRYQTVMAYTRPNPGPEHCLLPSPYRLELHQFRHAIEQAKSRTEFYQQQRDLAEAEGRRDHVATWDALIRWMERYVGILQQAESAA